MSQAEKTILRNGEMLKVPAGHAVDYHIPSTADYWGTATNLIPQLSSVSGARVIIGDKATTQAVTLTHRETPWVQSTPNHDEPSFSETYPKEAGAVPIASEAGVVKEVTSTHIKVDGKIYQLYDNFPSGRKAFIQHTPIVKVGDKVKAGQVLATSNLTDKHGHLALGTNLTTAVMPYRSLNFEDAFVVTESGAKKLEAEQLLPVHFDIVRGVELSKDKFVSLFANRYSNTQLSNIDSRGVVKKGTVLHHGDPVILAINPRTIKSLDAYVGSIAKLMKRAFNDSSVCWEYQNSGEVTDVAVTETHVTLLVKSKRGLETGDKISVVYGAKGVVGCYDEETEVLSQTGWLHWRAVTKDTLLASRDENGDIAYNKPLNLIAAAYCGELLGYNDGTLAYLVTPDHRMWSKHSFGGEYLFRSASTIFQERRTFMTSFEKPWLEHEQIAAHCYKLQYDGRVYCAEVPGGLVYVRRDSNPFWCGNSIIPDAQAPTRADGTPVDLLLNSQSVVSRIAPGLLNNMALGKIAEKTGKPIKLTHFNEGSNVQHAIDQCKKAGVDPVEKLYDPLTGQHVEVFTAPLYVHRLTHIAEDKISGRAEGQGYDWSMQPAKGGAEGAKRIGNLATAALLGHNAKAVLRDIGVVRGTYNSDFWRACKTGQPEPAEKVPFVFNKFMAYLQGAGVKVTQKGDVFHIFPHTDKDIKELSAGPITSALTYKLKKGEMTPEPNGLFDVNNVGIMGDRFNHIELGHPVPNPISEDFLRKLLKVTQKQFEGMIADGSLEKKLKTVNVEQELKDIKKRIQVAGAAERDNAVKIYAWLKNIQDHGKHPSDFMLHTVPVIPAQYRPLAVQGDMVFTSGANELYKDLLLVSEQLKKPEGLPADVLTELKAQQYQGVKAVYGFGGPINRKNLEKGYKGLMRSALGIGGGSAKSSFFQANVVNKPVDMVGRGVLTSDVKLGLDEASIPQEMAWHTYVPHIIRRMVHQGIPAVNAKKYVDDQHPLAKQALLEEMKVRPMIVSRDPALHKFNFQAYFPKMNADPRDKTIKLNPLLAKAYNFDHDGDQVNAQIPASEAARKEALERMLPSKNLLGIKSFTPMYLPGNEAGLGLFQASYEDHGNKPHHYATNEEVVRDFHSGKLRAGDKVTVG